MGVVSLPSGHEFIKMWLSNKYLTYTKLLILCLKIYSTSAACLSTEYPDPLDPNPNDNTYELCLPCPPGFACDGTSTITECTDGQYWDINACYNCPAGFYCPDKSTSKQYNCPIGTFSTGSATECTLCGANKFCSDPTQEQNCPTGNYASAGSTFCTPCPAGYDCTDPGNLAQCNVGSWSLLGQSTCSLCAAGSYCPSLTTGNQITCPENYYSDTVSNTCLACPAGTECTNNCNSLSDCQNCQVGEFSYAGGYCSACPEGYVCQGNPPQPPTFCNLGQISTDGNTCKDCDHGYFCPEMASEMTPCSKGYQSSPNNNQGAFECELCPDGLDCEDSTSNTTPVSCSNSANYLGKICVGGLVINCPRGTYRSNFLEPASSIDRVVMC